MRIHFVLPPLLAAISLAAAPVSGEDFGLGLTAEWIEVGLEDLPGLLREHGGDFDSAKLHSSVKKMIDAGKASREEVVYGWARIGERLSIGSYEEQIYATEYDPPEIPNTVTLTDVSADAVPRTGATPTAFETRNVGTSLEADPRINEKGQLAVTFVAEDVEFLGRDLHIGDEPKGPEEADLAIVWMPKFYTMKVVTTVVMSVEGSALVGTFTPPEEEKAGRRWMLFLHSRKIDWRPEEKGKKEGKAKPEAGGKK